MNKGSSDPYEHLEKLSVRFIPFRELAPESPYKQSSIYAIHQKFCAALPEELLWVKNDETGNRSRVEPGKPRTQHVRVGKHIPIDPKSIPRFMNRFETAYSETGEMETVIAAATAHHRLAWIHPFLDGNGRVIRLMSHAALNLVMDNKGLWSIARGLARTESDYKGHLAACDSPRHGDLDGRGNLSEKALAEFAVYFLETCIDQVNFMEGLIQPGTMKHRVLTWIREEIAADRLPKHADVVIEALMLRGALPRADVVQVLGASERTARRITSALLQCGIVSSPTTRTPLYFALPATSAERLMPGLYPTQPKRTPVYASFGMGWKNHR